MPEQTNTDQELASRKRDHIDLAFTSRVMTADLDRRFFYEPMLSAHPESIDLSKSFLGKNFRYPVWVSSMTGGTEKAKTINENLAKLCAEFGLGMGLGSCRALLDSDKRFEDFNLRPIIGENQPLYANLGIAQIEQLIKEGALDKIEAMVDKLNADGLIVHINPLQEWAQDEGDKINQAPIESVTILCEKIQIPLIVKEVGQGMGPRSLYALMKLPLDAIEFGASGGTNFTQLELNRSDDKSTFKTHFSNIGHAADDMVNFINSHLKMNDVQCREIIISGGVTDYLHGYYLMESCEANSIYGQASALLRYALKSYDELKSFFMAQMEGLQMAHAYLTIRQ